MPIQTELVWGGGRHVMQHLSHSNQVMFKGDGARQTATCVKDAI